MLSHIWNYVKRVLRIRHKLKIISFSPLLIEKGSLSDYAINVKTCSFGQNETFNTEPFRLYRSDNNFVDILAKDYSFPPARLVEIENAHILGWYAVPMVKNRLVTEYIGGNNIASSTLPLVTYLIARTKKVKQSYGQGFFNQYAVLSQFLSLVF